MFIISKSRTYWTALVIIPFFSNSWKLIFLELMLSDMKGENPRRSKSQKLVKHPIRMLLRLFRWKNLVVDPVLLNKFVKEKPETGRIREHSEYESCSLQDVPFPLKHRLTSFPVQDGISLLNRIKTIRELPIDCAPRRSLLTPGYLLLSTIYRRLIISYLPG